MKRVLADIEFFDKNHGGRSLPLPSSFFRCPIFFKGINELSMHGYDCRMLVQRIGRTIQAGDRVTSIPIVFLSPNDVLPFLFVGAEFDIWEAGVIGKGVISFIETNENENPSNLLI